MNFHFKTVWNAFLRNLVTSNKEKLSINSGFGPTGPGYGCKGYSSPDLKAYLSKEAKNEGKCAIHLKKKRIQQMK